MMRSRSRILLGLVCALALGTLVPASAGAQADPLIPTSVSPSSETEPPPGFEISLREARRIADRLPEVRRERQKDHSIRNESGIPLNLGDARRFQFLYY